MSGAGDNSNANSNSKSDSLIIPPDSKVLAFLLRHGQTAANQQDRFRGPIDFPLDRQGVDDAHNLSRVMSKVPTGSILSSDMQRAMHTAMIVGDRKGVYPRPDQNLRAWNVGVLAGQPKDSPEAKEFIKYYQDHPDEVVPKGESLNQFAGRVEPVILKMVKAGHAIGLPPIIVAHSSVVHQAGTMFNGDHESSVVKPGGVTAVILKDGRISAVPIYRADGAGSSGLS